MYYYSPIGMSAVTDEPYLLATPLDPNARVGLLANSFPGSLDFLLAFRDELASGYGIRDVTIYEKGGIRDSTELLRPEVFDRIAEECDVVFAAYGHCGSCSSALLRDGVALARAGKQVVVFVTEEFREVAELVTRASGMSELPVVFLPHPMASRSREERASVAVLRAGDAVTALTGGLAA